VDAVFDADGDMWGIGRDSAAISFLSALTTTPMREIDTPDHESETRGHHLVCGLGIGMEP